LLVIWTSVFLFIFGSNRDVENKVTTESKVSAVTIDYSRKLLIMDKQPDILDEVLGKKIPSFEHMLYVAWCESRQTWNDHGTYAGGFGFMHKSNKVYKDYSAKQSTWLQWGGAEFAKRPQDATSKEQALVWIRTYATGWTRPTGEFKPPTRPMKSLCHDDIAFGLHVYHGEDWPVSDNWKPGDKPVKPWETK
jgi:hypothetical protein